MPHDRSVIDYQGASAGPRRISRTSVRRFAAGVGACAVVALSGLVDEELAYVAALPLLAGTIYLQVARGWTAFSIGVGSAVALAIVIAGVCLLWFAVAMRGF